jgi:hypothetical protein
MRHPENYFKLKISQPKVIFAFVGSAARTARARIAGGPDVPSGFPAGKLLYKRRT